MAQLVGCLTLDFVSSHDLRVLGSSTVLGSMLSVESAWDSLSPSPSALPFSRAISLSQINKILEYYLAIMEYYLAIMKNESLSFVTVWMDLEDIMLCEIRQMEKDNYMISLIFGI